MGELIAVVSGKGGTGKTTVCAGVSYALALEGKRVLCIDCDVGLQNLDIALGISDYGALSFWDVCSGNYDLQMALKHPLCPGLSFLTAPMNCAADQIDPKAFSALLQSARQQFDYVFLDAPAGIEAGFALAARFADRILLVTGPDPAAIRDVSRAGQVLDNMGKHNIRIIVNRISKRLGSTLGLTVDDIMDTAGLPLMGIIPEDPKVIQAATHRRPLLASTKRGAAAACRRIARRLQGIPQPISVRGF